MVNNHFGISLLLMTRTFVEANNVDTKDQIEHVEDFIRGAQKGLREFGLKFRRAKQDVESNNRKSNAEKLNSLELLEKTDGQQVQNALSKANEAIQNLPEANEEGFERKVEVMQEMVITLLKELKEAKLNIEVDQQESSLPENNSSNSHSNLETAREITVIIVDDIIVTISGYN